MLYEVISGLWWALPRSGGEPRLPAGAPLSLPTKSVEVVSLQELFCLVLLARSQSGSNFIPRLSSGRCCSATARAPFSPLLLSLRSLSVSLLSTLSGDRMRREAMTNLVALDSLEKYKDDLIIILFFSWLKFEKWILVC